MTMLTKELLKSFEVSISDFGEAETLPSGLYTSEEFLTFEKEAIFSHEWLAVGRSDRIPEPGDWFTVTLLEEPLIVVRDKEARIRCLSAVCRHRAMAVCEGKGNNTTSSARITTGSMLSTAGSWGHLPWSAPRSSKRWIGGCRSSK